MLAEERAKHQEIKTLSTDIITAQENEIKMMRLWQSAWEYQDGSPAHGAH